MRLGTILHHAQIVPRGDRQERVHVRGLAVEVHGEQDTRARRDAGFHLGDIHEVRLRDDIDEDRNAARRADGGDGGHRGVGDGDHFVARLEPESFEREEERIRTGSDAHAKSAAAPRGKLLLKCADFRSQDQHPRTQDVADGDIDLFLQKLVLRRVGPLGDISHGSRSGRMPTIA